MRLPVVMHLAAGRPALAGGWEAGWVAAGCRLWRRQTLPRARAWLTATLWHARPSAAQRTCRGRLLQQVNQH